jgi:ABC-type phosphate/phosphonate transport system ATPase subunit
MKQLERVGIADKAFQRADELSGGQQQTRQHCQSYDAKSGNYAC